MIRKASNKTDFSHWLMGLDGLTILLDDVLDRWAAADDHFGRGTWLIAFDSSDPPSLPLFLISPGFLLFPLQRLLHLLRRPPLLPFQHELDILIVLDLR